MYTNRPCDPGSAANADDKADLREKRSQPDVLAQANLPIDADLIAGTSFFRHILIVIDELICYVAK